MKKKHSHPHHHLSLSNTSSCRNPPTAYLFLFDVSIISLPQLLYLHLTPNYNCNHNAHPHYMPIAHQPQLSNQFHSFFTQHQITSSLPILNFNPCINLALLILFHHCQCNTDHHHSHKCLVKLNLHLH